MVSIDLSKAFDKLRYSEMYESLQEAQIPEELCRLIMHIHIHTKLRIVHGGYSKHTAMQRGLRQGCGIAPMIYACWTIRLCRLPNQQISSRWAQNQCSIFADDKHFHWTINSCKDLAKALRQLRMVLCLIHELGMHVNFTKSIVVLVLKGVRAKKMFAKHTKWWNGARCLVLRMEDHDIYLPMQDSMPYLGTVLSYASFELQTAQHRVHQANSNFATLRDILRTNSALSRTRKLDIYRMCVWTTLTYGLVSVGITATSCRAIQTAAAMHLRKLLRIYQKGNSNEDVLRRANIELLPFLCQRAQQQARSLNRDTHRAADLRASEDARCSQIQDQLTGLLHVGLQRNIVQVHPKEAAHLDCPVCGVTFATASGLHQHLHSRHPEVAKAASIDFVREDHSLFGLPYCRFCRTRLASWQTLTKHITQGMCLRIKMAVGSGQSMQELLLLVQTEEAVDPPVPPAGAHGLSLSDTPVPGDMDIVLNTALKDLSQYASTLQAQAAKCMLCGQRLLQSSRVKSHWQASHERAWKLCHRHVHSEAQSLKSLFTSPCQYCGSRAKDSRLHSTQCPVMFQVLALRWFRSQKLDDWSLLKGCKSADVKDPRKEAAYKSFKSPMQAALTKGAKPLAVTSITPSPASTGATQSS